MASVKLPQYVILKGDNGKYISLTWTEKHPYLLFNSSEGNNHSTHEVFPVENQENVVMIKSVAEGAFWTRSPNWIWAASYSKPDASQKDCLFQVYQISPTVVALKCLANNMFLRRFTAEKKESALHASYPAYDDKIAQFVVSEGISARRVFDLEYMFDRMEKTDAMPVVLGKAAGSNQTNYLSDVGVTVTYTLTTTSTWSNSTSFMTGLSVSLQAGIPDLFSVTQTVSTAVTRSTEMGKENTESTDFAATMTIKDVDPGVKVTVLASATRAKGRIPYKYRYQDTAIDGTVKGEATATDGIFEGVQNIDVEFTATDDKGDSKRVVDVKEHIVRRMTVGKEISGE